MNRLLHIVAGLLAAVPAVAQTTTALLTSGTTGSKRDLVIVGDGFTAAQQGTFDTFVNDVVLTDLFERDVYREAKNAFNIWRVNVNSTDSGVTRVDAMGVVTTARNTALDYRYSGIWGRCWMEPGPNTAARLNAVLAATVPGAEFVFIVLNEAGGGGCRRGNQLAVTRVETAATCAHEMGHMIGNLGDEYTGGNSNFTGTEPMEPNLTKETNAALIKWRNYIPPQRPLPTLQANVVDLDSDVGLFQGATLGTTNWALGLFKPTFNSRMRSNTPEFCPVGYEAFRDALAGYETRTFAKSYLLDLNGDGLKDLALQNDTTLSLFQSDGSKLNPIWSSTANQNSHFTANQTGHVLDLDGDNRDDLILVRPGFLIAFRSVGNGLSAMFGHTNSLPGWTMGPNDRYQVLDFDGDNKDDLLVSNNTDWQFPFLLLLRSTGTTLQFVARFDGSLPNWGMARNDRHLVGDFDGDGRDDVAVWNGSDWAMPYLGLYRSTGSGLSPVIRYDGSLPSWIMQRNDQQFVGDFDADGRDDLYVWNADGWSIPYLSMQRSTGNGLASAMCYNGGGINGWSITNGDRFVVADLDGDRRKDLVVFNTANWNTEYLGILRSNGSSLSATWQADWIGAWNLGAQDQLLVGDLNGGGRDDLVIRNDQWLGLLRSNSTSFSTVRLYPKYIRNVPFHRLGQW